MIDGSECPAAGNQWPLPNRAEVDEKSFEVEGMVPNEKSQAGFHVDIHQLDNDHIYVFLEGNAVGMAAFADFDVFAKFVSLCQEFVDDRCKPKSIMDWFILQNAKATYAVPEVFLRAFEGEC